MKGYGLVQQGYSLLGCRVTIEVNRLENMFPDKKLVICVLYISKNYAQGLEVATNQFRSV